MPACHGKRLFRLAGRRCDGVDLMKMPSPNSKLISGAAIMLALWAIFLLSALVISWALDIDSRLSLSGEGARMLKAEAVACSGAEVALHPAVTPGSRNLSGQLDNGPSSRACPDVKMNSLAIAAAQWIWRGHRATSCLLCQD